MLTVLYPQMFIDGKLDHRERNLPEHNRSVSIEETTNAVSFHDTADSCARVRVDFSLELLLYNLKRHAHYGRNLRQ